MTHALDVHFRLFANLRELAGQECISVEVPRDTSIGNAFDRATNLHPELEPWRGRLAFARGMELVTTTTTVIPGDRIDVLPPVSGG
ncbi:MAG: MoaD/ThiS family protein [Phycisphaerales bacterium]|nr:MoaD/ThiS family protein [Phycisphaerales bacterium]